MSAASESQTSHGQEAVGGQPGELSEAVRQTQVEGKAQDGVFMAELPQNVQGLISFFLEPTALIQDCRSVQPSDADDEGPQAA